MTRTLGVIPARMGSSRFPGKPLASLHGRPMLEHVFRGTSQCELLDEVVIATCDREIAQAARGFGARAIMTSAAHERATDRVAEVSAGDSADVVVMVQGDEPMVRPEMVAAAVTTLRSDDGIACVNLVAHITDRAELLDRNTIKVVKAHSGDALFFSRSPIPYSADQAVAPGRHLKQVCVMAFRRSALRSFASFPQGPLEIAESVDMLRFLENGIRVRVVPTDVVTRAVDTPADLEHVARAMANR